MKTLKEKQNIVSIQRKRTLGLGEEKLKGKDKQLRAGFLEEIVF